MIMNSVKFTLHFSPAVMDLMCHSNSSSNDHSGYVSYWLLFQLIVVAFKPDISILPETKGISLERMDESFGQTDAVEAGETENTKAFHAIEGETVARSGSGDVEKRAL